jgi:hypothetical protein
VSIASRNAAFVKLLPIICRNARLHLRNLRREEREEGIQEIVASAFASFVRLVARRQAHRAYATPLALYAIRGFRAGRRAAARLNRFDVTSRYCHVQSGLRVQRLDHWDESAQEWREILIEDRRFPPAEAAAVRLDFAAWLQRLSPRDRRVALLLASGESTSLVAQCFQVTPGRVSQLRRELSDDWHIFVGDCEEVSPRTAPHRPPSHRNAPPACSRR